MTSATHLLPLTGYFLLILGLHALLPSTALPFSAPKSSRQSIFHILGALSLGVTWYFMILFMRDSYLDYYKPLSPAVSISSLSSWLQETQLFEQAWQIVCETPGRWWWSSQLCTYTAGIWTVFIWHQCNIPLVDLADYSTGTRDSECLVVYVYWTDCRRELCFGIVLGCSRNNAEKEES
jgi:hypothetical protein